MSMRAKEVLVERSTFPKLPIYLIESLVTVPRSAQNKMNKELVGWRLVTQMAIKVPGQDKINSHIL